MNNSHLYNAAYSHYFPISPEHDGGQWCFLFPYDCMTTQQYKAFVRNNKRGPDYKIHSPGRVYEDYNYLNDK